MQHGPAGEILDVGRGTRTISPALRRALAARDGQCRFPGCQNRRCDGHHIRHWADDGETALDNLVLLCRRHHLAVHEEGFGITLDAAGEAQFTWPDGRPFPAPPPPPWAGAALAPVTERLAQEVSRSTRRRPHRVGKASGSTSAGQSACCGGRPQRGQLPTRYVPPSIRTDQQRPEPKLLVACARMAVPTGTPCNQ